MPRSQDLFAPKASWQPDADARACPVCAREFTLTRRRHHCRLCKQIFCNSCSKQRFSRDFDGVVYAEPQRSCGACYAHLQTGVPVDGAPATYGEQVAILRAYYRQTDPENSERNIEIIMKAIKGKKRTALTPVMWGEIRTDLQRKYGRLIANSLTEGGSTALLEAECDDLRAKLRGFEESLASKGEADAAALLEPLRTRLTEIEQQIIDATAAEAQDDGSITSASSAGSSGGSSGSDFEEDLGAGTAALPAPPPAVYFDPRNIRILDQGDDPNQSVEVGSSLHPPPFGRRPPPVRSV